MLAEATSAASGAAASGGGEAATQAAHFGFSYAYGEQPMQVLDHMPKWFESIMKFMMPNKEVALFFQKIHDNCGNWYCFSLNRRSIHLVSEMRQQ